MEILVIPTTDWVGHPIPTRLHHVFEKIAEKHNVHVVRFRLYADKQRESNVTVHEINDTKIQNLALYYGINAQAHFDAIRRIVKENHIEIVVISNLLAGFMAAKAVGHRARTVFDLSDHFPSSGAGYYFNLNSSLGKMVVCGLEKLLAATLRQVDCTIVCSDALEEYAKGLGIDNVRMVPNGVNDVFFSGSGARIREELRLSGNLLVGYVGTVEFWLDIHPLLEAIKILSKTCDIKLVLLGSALKTRYGQKVKDMIERLEIGKNIVWLNFVPYESVPDYIDAMDICTVPFNSKHPTALYSAPIKMLEYFAIGKTVIATPIPNVLSFAPHYVNLAVTTEDYVRIIEDYVQNPEKYREQGRRSREIAKQLTWKNLAEAYEKVLERTIQGPGAG